MKKTALVISFALALLISAVAGKELVRLVQANPGWLFDFTASPNIKLDSPLNKTYTENVLLDFTVSASERWVTGTGEFWYDDDPEIVQKLNSVDCYVDGSLRGSIVANSDLSSPFHYSASLTDLQEGSHCLIVKTHSTGVKGGYIAGGVYEVFANSSSVTVYFSIEDTLPTTPNPDPGSLPTSLVMASAIPVIVVLVGIGWLLYGINRK